MPILVTTSKHSVGLVNIGENLVAITTCAKQPTLPGQSGASLERNFSSPSTRIYLVGIWCQSWIFTGLVVPNYRIRVDRPLFSSTCRLVRSLDGNRSIHRDQVYVGVAVEDGVRQARVFREADLLVKPFATLVVAKNIQLDHA